MGDRCQTDRCVPPSGWQQTHKETGGVEGGWRQKRNPASSKGSCQRLLPPAQGGKQDGGAQKSCTRKGAEFRAQGWSAGQASQVATATGCEAPCFTGDREGQGALRTGDNALNLQPQERRRPAAEAGCLGQLEGGKEW